MTNQKRLIVALDVDTPARALDLVSELREVAGAFKVGSQLFTATGPDIVRQIIARGGNVFLDLKFHDIPNTVESSAIEAVRLGVSIFNVHAAGGRRMMESAIKAVRAESDRLGITPPLLIAVTVLTSSDDSTLLECGVNDSVADQVLRLSTLSHEIGLNGVVASPREIRIIRQAIPDPAFVIVTPGVRPLGSNKDDQSRTMTPAQAITAGATYIVVGRPITSAPNPTSAALQILDQISNPQIRDAAPQPLTSNL
jgi:orotidine-5'-phosphate decarboxylase